MTSNDIELKVRAVICDVTKRDISALRANDDLVLSLGVDSLQGLQILAMVEKRCDVHLPDEVLIELRTVARITEAVEQAASAMAASAPIGAGGQS